VMTVSNGQFSAVAAFSKLVLFKRFLVTQPNWSNDCSPQDSSYSFFWILSTFGANRNSSIIAY
jgi:hypothetical protein